MTSRRSVCPAPCFDACALKVEVADGLLRSVAPDPAHDPTAGFLCSRGLRWPERLNHPDRLRHPLAREGRRGSGKLVPVTFAKAIDRIASALGKAAKQHDPRALLYLGGRDGGGAMGQFAQAFFAGYGGCSALHGDLCRSAGLEALRLTFGGVRHGPVDDFASSRMAILWGKNALLTSPHAMRRVEEARKRGLFTIAVDPIATETARACDLHLPIRPGTDGFLANAVANLLIESGRHDAAFVAHHAHGFEDYRWLVRNYEPSKAAETCGLPEAAIRDLADRFAELRPARILLGPGAQRYRNGGQTVRAIAALQSIAGNIGVRGGGLDFFDPSGFLARQVPVAGAKPPRIRQIGPLPSLGRAILNAQDPPVTAAIVERANPMAQHPFAAAVHHALERLEFLCVVDLFLTDTARRADVVLPASGPFEETDTVAGWWHGELHLAPACAERPGEARTSREIWRAIAEAMGHSTEPYEIDPESFLAKALPAGVTVARLRKQPFRMHRADAIPFADRRFPTPSGKVELRCDAAEISWRVDPLPFYTPPKESPASDPERAARFPLHLLTVKSGHRQASQWGNDETLAREEPPCIRLHPDDARARGLADGEIARVFNDRGEHRLPVRSDPSMRPGVAAVASGGWISRQGFTTNLWTHDGTTDMGYGAIYFDCLVQVEKPS